VETITFIRFRNPLGFILYFIGFKVGLFAGNEIIFLSRLANTFHDQFHSWLLAIVVIIFVIKPEVSLAHALSITMTSLAVCATFLIVIPCHWTDLLAYFFWAT